MVGVYKITNLINNKIYIGQSLDIKRRFNDHKNHTKNEHLKSALKKYGIDNFCFEPVFLIDNYLGTKEEQNILNEKEKEFINKFDSINPEKGYNKKEGGSNGRHTYETKRKIGAGNKGKVHSLEQNLNHSRPHNISEDGKNRMSEAHKGKCHRTNFNNGWLGKHIPEEHKQKIREARLKYHKKILLVETQEIFNSAQEIEDIYRIKRKRIITSIAEKTKACGLTFTYNLDTTCEKIISRDEAIFLLKENKSPALL